MLANFSINANYKQPTLLVLDFCNKIFENLDVMGKNGFHLRIQQRSPN